MGLITLALPCRVRQVFIGFPGGFRDEYVCNLYGLKLLFYGRAGGINLYCVMYMLAYDACIFASMFAQCV